MLPGAGDLQIRDEDFEQAAQTPTGAARNYAQLEAVSTRSDSQNTPEPEYAIPILRGETGGIDVSPYKYRDWSQ